MSWFRSKKDTPTKWGPQEIQEWCAIFSYARKDPRLGFWPRFWIALAIGYLVSPIDLIPDFIPFFGQLDDFFVIPLLLTLAIKSIPPVVITEARERWIKEKEAGVPLSKKRIVFFPRLVIGWWIIIIGGIVVLLLFVFLGGTKR
ncbi:MAG: YkvA family protein [Treponemataceae bacterium]|nr:YkvA family protein [Treponemataceae bacterium]